MAEEVSVVRWYDTPEAIHAVFVAGLADASGESLAGASWGGEDAEGNPVEFSEAQMLDGYRAQGAWGFCDGQRIHLWADEVTETAQVVWMVAHELAHLWGADAPDIAAREESGAELVGRIAATAHSIVMRRIATHSQSSETADTKRTSDAIERTQAEAKS